MEQGVYLPQHLFGVGKLWHQLRMHEARGLNDGVACVDESLDELGLDAAGRTMRLVLQAVSRPDLVDRDARRQGQSVEGSDSEVHVTRSLRAACRCLSSLIIRGRRWSCRAALRSRS